MAAQVHWETRVEAVIPLQGEEGQHDEKVGSGLPSHATPCIKRGIKTEVLVVKFGLDPCTNHHRSIFCNCDTQ